MTQVATLATSFLKAEKAQPWLRAVGVLLLLIQTHALQHELQVLPSDVPAARGEARQPKTADLRLKSLGHVRSETRPRTEAPSHELHELHALARGAHPEVLRGQVLDDPHSKPHKQTRYTL